ncbi:putative secreted beta-lactamase [Stachybotrys elegans]|uniref:Secreted beta-lactamase n=1 Tax=Stachybotrys elegans TaxID=80388 RepID=A0A8K0SQN8_9HYPO|nr:putative secreted beta-lactamase [Stachybotrys elegans]
MKSFFRHSALLLLLCRCSVAASSTKVCPLLGPGFPVPTNLPSNDRFQKAVAEFNQSLDNALKTGNTPLGPFPVNLTSFSIGMFNVADEGMIYQYHYTDPVVQNSTVGTKEVNANTVYRLASISKMLTVYLFLITEGLEHYHDPITNYIPELTTIEVQDGVAPDWRHITIGQLASHFAGLGRSYGITDIGFPWSKPSSLPDLPDDQLPRCSYVDADNIYVTCTEEDLLEGLASTPPIFHTSSSPGYSDKGFILISIALARASNSTWEDLFMTRIVQALGLTDTTYQVPRGNLNAAIPLDVSTSGWDFELGPLSPAGGYFSSTHDMAKIGTAILNSTLLSAAETRQWLTPSSFTASPRMAAGAPWEIFRTEIKGRTVDMYCKNGGLLAYSTLFVLVPDFQLGFSILTASSLNGNGGLVWAISEMISDTFLPALEDVAREQARAVFEGTYSNGTSTLEIVVDEQPGLRVMNWTNNGEDVMEQITGITGDDVYVDFRLQPNGLYSGNTVGFTGWFDVMPNQLVGGHFDLNCLKWGGVDGITHGNLGLGSFTFQVDSVAGRSVSIRSMALRNTLERV